jgi:flavin-dependent dehydrogenase
VRREATLILGGGPAGSAAAITLARADERPLVLERQRETGDALCGGFLSWHSLALLDQLGLPRLRGATVDHVRLFGRPVERGVAIAFGPGLAAEGFRFRSA